MLLIEFVIVGGKMLKVIYGDVENSIYNTSVFFDNQYEDEWIVDPMTIAMIKDIDKSDVVGPLLIQSPVLGPISSKEISGGVKTLILMKFYAGDKIFNASACGDNCAKWIVEIAKEKDLVINLHHIMDFSNAGNFEAIILNSGNKVHNNEEFFHESVRVKIDMRSRGEIL